LTTGFTVFKSKSARGFARTLEITAVDAITAVVVASCGEGRNCSTTPISSYNVIQIVLSSFNSKPTTFSF